MWVRSCAAAHIRQCAVALICAASCHVLHSELDLLKVNAHTDYFPSTRHFPLKHHPCLSPSPSLSPLPFPPLSPSPSQVLPTCSHHVTLRCMGYLLLSGEGERVPLGGAMKARGGPEGWLTAVETLMRSALKAATKRAMKEYPVQPRVQWVRQQPAQLVLLVSNIFWCKQVKPWYFSVFRSTLAQVDDCSVYVSLVHCARTDSHVQDA